MNTADRSGPASDIAENTDVHESRLVPPRGFPHHINPTSGSFDTGYVNLIGATLTWVASGFQCRRTIGSSHAMWYTTWIWSDSARITAGANEIGYNTGGGFTSSGLNFPTPPFPAGFGNQGDNGFWYDPDQKLIFRLRFPDKDTVTYAVAPVYNQSLLEITEVTPPTLADYWLNPSAIGWGWPPPAVKSAMDNDQSFAWPHGIIVHSFNLELGN